MKKAISPAIRLMAILSLMLFLPFAASHAQERGTDARCVFDISSLSGSSIFAQPSESSDVLGDYPNGAFIQVSEQDDTWFRVTIGAGPGQLAGYIQKSKTSFDSAGLSRKLQYVQVISGNGEPVPVYDQPYLGSQPLGYYPTGTILELLGKCGEFAHVKMGAAVTTFIQLENIRPTNRGFMRYTGAEPIGFAEVRGDIEEPFSVLTFPNVESKVVDREYSVGIPGAVFELIDSMGDWCQVRRAGSSDYDQGFVPSNRLTVYTFDSLIGKEEFQPVGAGTYVVGRDIPEGLYAFYLNDGEFGEITVSMTNSWNDRTYGGIGKCAYSLYLPDQAIVTITGKGFLRHPQEGFLANVGDVIAIDGRFLVGVQLPGGNGPEYTITARDTEKPAFYVLSTIGGYYGDDLYVSTIPLEREVTETVVTMLKTGTFIELQNCVITRNE